MTQQSRICLGKLALVALLTLPALAGAAPKDPQKFQVFAVENALAGAGYTLDSADGVADASTREALRAFQEEQPGLAATGEIDEPTLLALGVKREDSSYDREAAKRAAEQAKPSYDPTKTAAPAGKAGNGADTPQEEEEGWLFSW